MSDGAHEFLEPGKRGNTCGSGGGGIELAPRVTAPPDAVRIQFARGGGPGGQNVNKLNTKAELWVHVARIQGMTHAAKARLRALAGRRLTLDDRVHLASESQRSQEANRNDVLDRLRQMIVRAAVEPKPRRKTKPSKAAKRRRLDAKRHRGELKAHRRRPAGED